MYERNSMLLQIQYFYLTLLAKNKNFRGHTNLHYFYRSKKNRGKLNKPCLNLLDLLKLCT